MQDMTPLRSISLCKNINNTLNSPLLTPTCKIVSYKKYTIPQLNSREWFDKASEFYRQYWTHLNSVDNNRFLRYLPRSLKGLSILDIGAGDGRVFEHFKNSEFQRYIALDISQKMLDHFRSSQIEKICTDCSEHIPLESESMDLALGFFFFEYINTLHDFFDEMQRILKPWGTFVATYFYQRNAFVRGHGDEAFKIAREGHTYDDIKKAAEYAFFHIEETPILDQGRTVGYIYVFTK